MGVNEHVLAPPLETNRANDAAESNETQAARRKLFTAAVHSVISENLEALQELAK